MGKKHHSHWSDKGHGHHKHDGFGDHHHGKHHHGKDHHGKHDHGNHDHGKHGFVFGSRGDNVLEGTDKKDVIFGLKGNDQLFGRDGNDWLFGGKGKDLLDGGAGNDKLFGGKGSDELLGGDGNDKLSGDKGGDVLDGGAGSDKLFGGKGNDVAVYSLAENASADACGNATRDFYDGGQGKDILHLILTKQEFERPDVKADLEAFQAFLDENPGGCGRNGEVYEFQSFGLTVRNFEVLEYETGNTPPDAVPDSYTTNEDVPLDIKVNKGVLANDSDADGDALVAPVALVTGPTHGTLVFNEDGSFTYTPSGNYFGPDSFSYQASDGTDTSEAIVDIEVLPINDAPQLKDPTTPLPGWQVQSGETISINILDYYFPGPPENELDQSVELRPPFAFATVGSAAVVGDVIEYTAPANHQGMATIGYLVFDNLGASIGANDILIDII